MIYLVVFQNLLLWSRNTAFFLLLIADFDQALPCDTVCFHNTIPSVSVVCQFLMKKKVNCLFLKREMINLLKFSSNFTWNFIHLWNYFHDMIFLKALVRIFFPFFIVQLVTWWLSLIVRALFVIFHQGTMSLTFISLFWFWVFFLKKDIGVAKSTCGTI